jgi:template-activating factor I
MSNGQKRKKAETSSFFAWFSDEDLEVADLIADDLYPNAVKYFSGTNEDEIEEEEDENEDEEDEEESDEEEGEDEEDDGTEDDE